MALAMLRLLSDGSKRQGLRRVVAIEGGEPACNRTGAVAVSGRYALAVLADEGVDLGVSETG